MPLPQACASPGTGCCSGTGEVLVRTLIVTGGAGFIGCNFVRLALKEGEHRVVVLDKLTYAGNRESLAEVEGQPGYAFVQADIADREAVRRVFAEHRPDAVVNFAAETHV